MRLTSLALALLIFGVIYYWFALRGPAEDAVVAPAIVEANSAMTGAGTGAGAEQNQPVPVMVIESHARPTVNQIVLRGRTWAVRNVSVPAETPGLVISQPLRKGTTVAGGDVLCRLDPGARAAQLLEAEARRAEARIEAEAATTLSQKGFASETTRTARQAQLETAQAQVDLVMLDIARLVIHAPFDGVLETDGLITLGGRSDDTINFGGNKIPPRVVEQGPCVPSHVGIARVGAREQPQPIPAVLLEPQIAARE